MLISDNIEVINILHSIEKFIKPKHSVNKNVMLFITRPFPLALNASGERPVEETRGMRLPVDA